MRARRASCWGTSSADEVVHFLEAVPSLKACAALSTAYAAGLRASEAVSLKVADIDSDRMVLQIRHGKGAKDRTVMLSPQLLGILRTYWRLARPISWLFPGRGDKPMDVQVLHSACRSATRAAGLTKKVSVHTARDTASPPIFSRAVWTSGSSGCCSDTRQPVDHCAHHAGCHDDHREDAEPVRSPEPREVVPPD